MNSSSGKQPSFPLKLPVCWTAAMCEVCLRSGFSLQHISRHVKAASCWAGRSGGSVNGWTCEQQVMIVAKPRPLIACDSSLSPVLSSHGKTLTESVMQVEGPRALTSFVWPPAQHSLCLCGFISNILAFQDCSWLILHASLCYLSY